MVEIVEIKFLVICIHLKVAVRSSRHIKKKNDDVFP